MLVLGSARHAAVEEDGMYLVSTDQLAAEHVAELHRQAERAPGPGAAGQAPSGRAAAGRLAATGAAAAAAGRA
jgi:hypothetical protein